MKKRRYVKNQKLNSQGNQNRTPKKREWAVDVLFCSQINTLPAYGEKQRKRKMPKKRRNGTKNMDIEREKTKVYAIFDFKQ